MARIETLAEGVTLHLGDCREIVAQIGAVDLMLTDPPYGIAYGSHDKSWSRGSKIVGDENMAAGQAMIDWAFSNDVDVIAFAHHRRPWTGEWRSWLAWDKGGAVGGGGDTAKCFKLSWELVQVYQRGALLGGRDQSVLRFPSRRDMLKDHPAAKPVELISYLMGKVAGDVVFDPFMGSGTTGVAAAKSGRKFVGIEIDRAYFDIACRRIDNALRQSDIFGRTTLSLSATDSNPTSRS